MTVSLNEVASLVQQLESIRDDSNRQIISIDIGSMGSTVQLGTEGFLTEFVDFEIVFIEHLNYPYRLSTSIGGIEFMSLMNADEIVDLKTSMPEQWEYIQRKVQVS